VCYDTSRNGFQISREYVRSRLYAHRTARGDRDYRDSCFLAAAALSKSKEKARRVICASNLRQSGIAVTLYVDDNRFVPESIGGPGYRHPSVINIFKKGGTNFYNVEALTPYLPGIRVSADLTELNVGGVWRCPGTQKPTDEEWRSQGRQWGYLSTPYSFFGRVDLWPNEATQPQDLTANELRADRLLSSDILYKWWVDGTFVYNHGAGATWTEKSPDRMSGVNQLYGDAHVSWKPAKQFNLPELQLGSRKVPAVIGYGGSISFY
jgi:hypothetical protein